MDNEQIVQEIKNGINTSDNLERLYKKNLTLIKQIIKPYTALEEQEDLLQECYFALVNAVNNYECFENVKFMTYAKFWLKQACMRYIENCGRSVRLPVNLYQDIIRYKKAITELSHDLGRYPEDAELVKHLGISKKKLNDLRMYSQDVKSLNTSYTTEDGQEYELLDTIEADLRLEESVIDNLYDEHCKSELWGIVECYTSEKESDILQERFKKCKSRQAIANDYNVTRQRIREIEHTALRKLRRASVKEEIEAKFDLAMVGAYRTGANNFKTTWESSTERTALKMIDYDNYVQKRLAELKCKIGVENC